MTEYLRRCLRSLARKKLRSALTVLSIAIGVASVVLVGSIGEIGKSAITTEIEGLGMGSVTVRVDSSQNPGAQLGAAELPVIRQVEGVESAVPIMMEYTQSSMCGLVSSCVAWGIDAGGGQVIAMSPLYGRLISPGDVNSRAKVCVVDENMAKAFYKRSNIVGKEVTIVFASGSETFTVVGVVESGGNIMQSMLSGYIPFFVYLPYTTVQQHTGRANFDRVAVKVLENEDVDGVGELLTQTLARATMGKAESYQTENMFRQKENLSNILSIITLILSAIAGISLLVAGLGIMTVMLVSVSERTREIGIKKAIGAKERTILIEFLVEAFTISLMGSIVGLSVGLGVVWGGCALLGVSPALNPGLIWVSIGVSVGVGVLFGAYPAKVASRMRPVDALRFE